MLCSTFFCNLTYTGIVKLIAQSTLPVDHTGARSWLTRCKVYTHASRVQ